MKLPSKKNLTSKHKQATYPQGKSHVFDNSIIQDIDGQFLSYCSSERLQWYLDRDLATLVCADPMTINLKFEPSGRQNSAIDGYASSIPKLNLCAVCGKTQNMDRHHVIPHTIIKHLPVDCKRHNAYDVLPLCLDCHHKYELVSWNRKIEIAEEMGIHHICEDYEYIREIVKMTGYARTIVKHGNKIPKDRQESMIGYITSIYGKIPTEEDLRKLGSSKPRKEIKVKSFGQLYVEKIGDPNKIAKDWRQHFVSTMKPKHLPQGWVIDRSF